MMLALVAFSMSMVGTFLVRSGILTSVHSFAVDPTRGTFILMLLGIYIGGALTLFALRIAHVREGAPFEVVSREGGLVLNNLVLSVILGIVLVGTLYPLIAEALSGEKLSVGPPYFNSVASPLALVLAALMMIAPQLRWRRDATPILPRLAPGVIVAVTVLAASLLLWPAIGTLPRIGLAIGAGLLPASLQPLFGRSVRRTPLAVWGMAIAHLGVAVAIIGMSSDSAFTREKLAAATPGETIEVGPWLVEFRQVIAKPNGITLVTGPTGAGKTTTLYSALSELNVITDKIITTEDPVEYEIAGLVQCQINHEIDEKDYVQVRLSDRYLRLVRSPARHWSQTIRTKLEMA
jgi:cytochrome c-type biogenesis protein CcmF